MIDVKTIQAACDGRRGGGARILYTVIVTLAVVAVALGSPVPTIGAAAHGKSLDTITFGKPTSEALHHLHAV